MGGTVAEYLTQTQVLARRGWTKTLITKLIGLPDRTETSFGPPWAQRVMAYRYEIGRVVSAENADGFRRALAQWEAAAPARKVAAARARATRYAHPE
jgi:hypothetical protein